MKKSVAFLGLGVMGFPMAGHLAHAGHRITVYNRTAEKAAEWLRAYDNESVDISVALTPAEAAKNTDFVFACVGADKDILNVAIGPEGAFSTMKAGAIFVDHTTVSPDTAKILYTAAKQKALGFIDAPVSGGQAGAENGVLTIMCGGDQGDFDQVSPVMQTYGRMVKLLGGAGAGQTAKMVNQVCIAGVVQGLAEGLALAKKAGLDAKAVADVISKGAAGSWQMDNRAHTMVDGQYDFGFAVDWMRKDLAIVLDQATKLGLTLPVTEMVDGFYREVQSIGGNRQDTSSLMRRYEEK